jgi:tetratricopeptide (TPR) repeat protein
MEGAREVAFLPLVRLADVEQERRIVRAGPIVGLDRRDLVDLRLRLRENFSVCRHYFREYSNVVAAYGCAWYATHQPAGVFPATLVGSVSPRVRVVLLTAAVAAVSAGVVVGVAARSGGEPPPQTQGKPQPGAPPLTLDLGVRDDVEARSLRQAATLYRTGRRAQARAIFERYDSLPAQVGRALAAWPDGTIAGLGRLALLYPRSALVQLELGLALFWAGREGATDAWRQATVLEPDSSYAVTAGNLLYPQYARSLPTFIPDQVHRLDGLRGQPPAQQLRTLRRWARAGTVESRTVGHLLYGVALQRLGHPLSARREYDRAAALEPGNPETLVASAVGRFDKADPAAAFSRLGPLARRFPKSATVRFHLGLLLLWIGSVKQAKVELHLAVAAQPSSTPGLEAQRYLTTLAKIR